MRPFPLPSNTNPATIQYTGPVLHVLCRTSPTKHFSQHDAWVADWPMSSARRQTVAASGPPPLAHSQWFGSKSDAPFSLKSLLDVKHGQKKPEHIFKRDIFIYVTFAQVYNSWHRDEHGMWSTADLNLAYPFYSRLCLAEENRKSSIPCFAWL